MNHLLIHNISEEIKKSVCRVCLKYNSEGFEIKVLSVFESYSDKLICDKINDIVSIDIQEGDGLPDKICSSCVQSLETAYEFKQKCKHSDNILRSAIQTGVSFQEIPIEHVPVKEDPLDSVYNEDIYSEEHHTNDIKHEYEYNKLYRPQEQFQSSTLLTPHSCESKSIDLHLECHDCGQFFKSKCKLRVHWKKEHMPSQLSCPRCKKVCKTYKSFHAHMKRSTKSCALGSNIEIEGEGKSRIFHCTQCEYKTGKIAHMKIHWRIHSGERPYSCNICNKSFTQTSSLQKHKEGFHKMIVKEGVCKHCGKHIQGGAKFNRHVRSHTASYPCKLCGKVLKSKGALDDHTRRHNGIKRYTCEICAKMFSGAADLSNHKAIVHLKSRSYKCNKCGFTARSHKTVALHKTRHTGTNIPCIICGRFVENELQLKLHIERHNKNFDCEHCGKSFNSWKNVLNHIRKIHKIR